MPVRHTPFALLVAVVSAPAWANDPALTTQQTAVGEAAVEMSVPQEGMAASQQSSAPGSVIENSDRIPPPEARLGGPREPAALPPIVPRQPSASHRPPLILGIGH